MYELFKIAPGNIINFHNYKRRAHNMLFYAYNLSKFLNKMSFPRTQISLESDNSRFHATSITKGEELAFPA